MDQQSISNILWEGNLQDDFDRKASDLFLKRNAKTLPSVYVVYGTASEATSPTVSDVSEKTLVNTQCTSLSSKYPETIRELHDVEEIKAYKSTSKNLKHFFIEHQGNSLSPLNITSEVFNEVCSEFSSSNRFRNIISHMGSREPQATDIAPPPLYWESQVCASGLQAFELCYALNYVAENHRNEPGSPWSIRQFAVQSQVSVQYGTGTWLFISLPRELLGATLTSQGSAHDQPSISSAQTHILLVQQALANYREYLLYLKLEVERPNNDLAFAHPSGCKESELPNIQLRLRDLEDQIEDTKLSLLHNNNVLESLKRPLHCLCASASAPLPSQLLPSQTDQRHVLDVYDHLGFAQIHITSMLQQLEALKAKISSCLHIASSSSVLSNGRVLQEIATRNQRDATTVMALTVIASVFLPVTVVLNFFSTTFVENQGGKLVVLQQWWLLLAITLPMTVSVILFWRLWVRKKLPKLGDDSSMC